jgi:ligand-binding SRPBCC domain-containing protein
MAETTFHLRVWTRFFDPLERVWAVKTDPDVMRAEFPPGFSFDVDDPAALKRAFDAAEAVTVSGRFGALLLGPGRLPWPVRLEAVEPLRRYRDTSENALFTRFEHEHLFQETVDGTRYIDAVTFTPRLPAAKATAILMQRVFAHRHRVAARHLQPDTRTVGTAVLRVLGDDETR